MTQKKIFKNYLWLVAAETFSKLLVFASFAYLARLLGPASFGYVEWSFAVLMCAGLIVDQGLSSYGAREIAKNPGQTAKLTTEIVTARFLLAALSYLAVAIFAFCFVREQTVARLLPVFGLSLFPLPILLNWVFQGHDRMNVVALIQIVRYTVFALVVFVLVRASENLLFVAMAEIAAVACAGIFSVLMYRRAFPSKILLRPALSFKLIREGFPIGLSQMFWTVKMFGAVLIFGLIAAPEETGYFSAAMRILIAMHAFVWLYYLNLLPSLARAWNHEREQFGEFIGGSMRVVTIISLAGAGLWIAVAPFAVTLVYGQNFSGASGALQWLAGVCAAAAISGHFRFGLIAAGFQNKELLTAVLGASLALIFIPLGYFGWQTSGAAAGLFFAELSVLLSSWLIARRTLFDADSVQKNPFESLPEASR